MSKRERVFNSRKYHHYGTVSSKREASRVAKVLRSDGRLVRIIHSWMKPNVMERALGMIQPALGKVDYWDIYYTGTKKKMFWKSV